jgi:adenine-specific DNA-methyltransferase
VTAAALDREQARLALQAGLDAKKTQAERNSLGQFATPTALATEILTYARTLLGSTPAAFLDPAIGTGSFYSALLRTFAPSSIERAEGYEIDPHYAEPARALWNGSGLHLHVGDFTRATPRACFNLLVSNPPYVRHHHIGIDEKLRLHKLVFDATGIRLGGLSGLYCYFMCLSSVWLSDGGIAAWLVPSEFMDVNYGRRVKDYLLSKVTLLRVHRFDPNEAQFDDALVSSALVWFRKAAPPAEHRVEFTYGGKLQAPRLSRTVAASELAATAKWTGIVARNGAAREAGPTFSDLFTVKRGVATGDNNYFILTEAQVAEHELPMDVLRPILPSPRYLPVDEVPADARGLPVLDRRLFLLCCSMPEEDVQRCYPALHRYLARGRAAGRLPLRAPFALVRAGAARTLAIPLHLHGPVGQDRAAVPVHPQPLEGHRGKRLLDVVSPPGAGPCARRRPNRRPAGLDRAQPAATGDSRRRGPRLRRRAAQAGAQGTRERTRRRHRRRRRHHGQARRAPVGAPVDRQAGGVRAGAERGPRAPAACDVLFGGAQHRRRGSLDQPTRFDLG